MQSTFAVFSQPKTVEYKDGNQILSGLSILPAKQLKNKPGVLILPAWMGIQDHEKEVSYKFWRYVTYGCVG